MNKLIITFAMALCAGVSAFAADCATNNAPALAAKTSCKANTSTELTVRDRRDAERCGIAFRRAAMAAATKSE